MEDISIYLSQKRGQHITYNALKEIYKIAEGQSSPKEFPGKAIDLLNNISNSAKNKGTKVINKEYVDRVASTVFNIPVGKAGDEEKAALLGLEDKIHQRVIGQQEAVVAVAN